jgi:hypothetical protein
MAELQKEITGIITLLGARAHLAETEQSVAMETNMVAMVSRKITGAKTLDHDDALLLYETLVSCKLKPVLVQALQQAIDTRVSAMATDGPANAAEAKKQLFTWFLTHLTANDWLQLDDVSLSLAAKKIVLIMRMRALGLRDIEEQTVKWAVAILINCFMVANGGNWPSYHYIYQQVQEFKATWTTTARPSSQPWMATYPQDPNSLPPAMFLACYGEEAPIYRDMPMLHTILLNMVMRSSSKFLRQEKEAMAMGTFGQPARAQPCAANPNVGYWGSVDGVPINMASHQYGSMASSSHQPMLGYHPATRAGQAPLPSQPSSSHQPMLGYQPVTHAGQAPLPSQPMSPPPLQQPLALGNGLMDGGRTPSASPTRDSMGMAFKPAMRLDHMPAAAMQSAGLQPEEKADEPKTRVSSETYEDNAMEALTSKKAKAAAARAAAKAMAKSTAEGSSKAKASGKAKPQPKAKAATEPKVAAMKRPAAAMNFGYGVNWDKHWTGTQASWTSKHYHAAKRLAQAEGQSAARCTEVAKKAFADASRAWQHNH